MYTVQDARREVQELVDEGYGFDYIRIFLNDLARSKDITWDDHKAIMIDLFNGKYDIECSFGTL
jgi:hypothetical protein